MKEQQGIAWNDIVKKHVEHNMNSIHTEMSQVLQTLKITKNETMEMMDQESRKNNITIYRVPESKALSTKLRSEEDQKFIYCFIREGLQLDCADGEIIKILRLGKFINSDRPIMIQFKERTTKNIVMESLGKFRGAHIKYKNFLSHMI